MKYYSGKFRPKNLAKYEGDYTNVIYRSFWEFKVLRWCDENPDVVSYSSEEVVIPYRCLTDRKMHRYFMDLKIKFSNGKTFLVEIKPKSQTLEPKRKGRTTKKFLAEVMTYAKNQSKWNAADALCQSRGWTFAVWTEDHLSELGIKILTKDLKKK
jgi:hypothetical protein